jgi:hypothetical protein
MLGVHLRGVAEAPADSELNNQHGVAPATMAAFAETDNYACAR